MKYPAETFVFLLGSILLISSLSFVAPSTESRMPTDPIDYEFFRYVVHSHYSEVLSDLTFCQIDSIRPKYHVIAKKNWVGEIEHKLQMSP